MTILVCHGVGLGRNVCTTADTQIRLAQLELLKCTASRAKVSKKSPAFKVKLSYVRHEMQAALFLLYVFIYQALS